MLDIRSNGFLSKDEIKQKASSIFTTTASPNTSEKYSHISTERILDDMMLLGWNVVDCKQVKARKGIGFQKHLIVFRNNELVINGKDGDVVYPQILLTNSHDGKNAFTFTAGLFRMICENGLVVSDKEFENMKIRHMGYDFEVLQETIKSMVEKLPLTVDAMNRFKQVILGQDKALEFAKKALETRFSEEEINRITINFNELLTPTRPEDKGDDLWSVYNVVQEKLTHGMFEYGYASTKRKARKIKNFQQDLKLNTKLWELAEQYI
jgi:hypothetical protein